MKRLWDRSLDHYPANTQRIWYLALTLLAIITMQYEFVTLTSVAPLVQAHFHLSLQQYGYIVVLANTLGALAALVGSLSDRIGRANLIVLGLLVGGVCTLATALATSLWSFLFLYCGVGFLVGIMLTLTVALMRDFSPRLGRAAAMGFWTVGPVGGGFLASWVASLTLPISHTWQSQYVIAGSIGLVVFLVCLVGLRDLAAGLRDQVMGSLREKALVEARASSINVDAALKHPWRQMLRPQILILGLGINLFLLLPFSARGFFVIFLSSSFKFPLAEANGMVSTWLVVMAISAVVVGFLSDAARVRKPFMLSGAIALIIVTLLFLSRIGQPPNAALMTVLLTLMGICNSLVFVPWLAAFTETVESINPSLVATGSAVEVFISRGIATISTLALPLVVGEGQGWGTWWWVCVVGQVLFLPTILLASGYWNPLHARAAVRAREQAQTAEV